VQEQLAKDRRQQELLQRTVDDLRNFTVKQNEGDIRKLRKHISEMEQTLSHAGKDKATSEEKKRELEEARLRMNGLESQSEVLQAELRKKQLDVETLQQEMARGAALLEEKQRELTRLQEREVVNAGIASRATAEAVAAAAAAEQGPGSPGYYLSYAAEVAGAIGSRGWRLASKLLFSRRSSALLVRAQKEFEMLELRGCHLGSTVWRARDNTVLEPEEAIGAVKWKRESSPHEAYREAMILSTFGHDNIMPLLGLIDGDDGRVGLVMPFFEHDLEYVLAPDNVDNLRLEVGAQPLVAAGLLAALAYSHAQQVVHRSISSSVVLVAHRNGRVVLGGWSEAVSLSTPGKNPLVIRGAGSRYLSPEYLLDPEHVNWKAFDVWACGCVIWELLLENSLAPLVVCESSDLRELMRSLCCWTELREQAEAWLAAQPDRSRFPALEQELAAKRPASKSLVAALQEKMVAPPAIALLIKMLAWDPAKRISAYNATLDEYLSGIAKPIAVRDVVDQKSLSDSNLESWIASIKQ
jgi:serine/threonine protein kinase